MKPPADPEKRRKWYMDMARSCAIDAASRHARKAGRKQWTEEEADVYVDTYNSVFPVDLDLKLQRMALGWEND